MDETSPDSTPTPTVRLSHPRPRFGLIGLLVGSVGLVIAVVHPHLAEALKPPPPPPQKLSDTLAEAGDKFVGRMIDRVRGKKAATPAPPPPPPQPQPLPWAWYLSLAATSLGLIGAASGTIAWVRREDHRLAASAITAGALAVAWVYILAALVIALVIVFLLFLLAPSGG